MGYQTLLDAIRARLITINSTESYFTTVYKVGEDPQFWAADEAPSTGVMPVVEEGEPYATGYNISVKDAELIVALDGREEAEKADRGRQNTLDLITICEKLRDEFYADSTLEAKVIGHKIEYGRDKSGVLRLGRITLKMRTHDRRS